MIRKSVQIGQCLLVLGDSTLAPWGVRLEGDSGLTDPPFGISYRSAQATERLWSEDRIRGDESTAVRDAVLSLLEGMPVLAFGSWKAPRPAGTRMVLAWDKGPALGMGAMDLPWKPSSEEIYVIGKGFVGKRDEGAIIYCPPVQSMAKNGRAHPNQKPVKLLRHLMAKLPFGRVIDPFMGSGSTGVAAVLEGRPFVGVEIDERYFDIACSRIREANSQPLFDRPSGVQRPLNLGGLA